MAFAILHAFPFGGHAAAFGGPSGCRMSCGGAARAGACASRRRGQSCRSACSFSFDDGEAARSFEIVETPEAYFVFFDASDFRRDDLKVWVSEDRLFLAASKDDETVLEKSWTLPDTIFEDGVSAKLGDNHELTIVLPKAPEKPKVDFHVPIEGSISEPAQDATKQEQPSTSAAAGFGDYPEPNETNNMEGDGSWVDVADEDVARAKEKGKGPMEGPVVDEA